MAKPSRYELLYNAVKSILKWHVVHEKNDHAKEAYSSLLSRMEKLEKMQESVRPVCTILKLLIDGEPVQ